ncbi:hypothetical protein [Methanobrevibacter smithii]|uniref:hypothetical protein n=1 Tax=Methanobrevibacter smithii TaxID=2173 RepID=UPI001C00B041|nr:hypothetical protein [Methanobrevibacter smithii]MBT9657997.1 hypothetical protein [Methanobrevibacter smithii]
MYFRILEDNLKPIQDITLQELCDQDTRLSILLDLANSADKFTTNIYNNRNKAEFENTSYEELEKLIIEELKESAFMWQIKRLLLLDINNCWK